LLLKIQTIIVQREKMPPTPYQSGMKINGDVSVSDNMKYNKTKKCLQISSTAISATRDDVCLDMLQAGKAMGLPKMTTAQVAAIAAPTSGMAVFNTTTASVQAFNGTEFTELGYKSQGALNKLQKADGNGKFLETQLTESGNLLTGVNMTATGALQSGTLSSGQATLGATAASSLSVTGLTNANQVNAVNVNATGTVTADSGAFTTSTLGAASGTSASFLAAALFSFAFFVLSSI
jgi:hypothetical protein